MKRAFLFSFSKDEICFRESFLFGLRYAELTPFIFVCSFHRSSSRVFSLDIKISSSCEVNQNFFRFLCFSKVSFLEQNISSVCLIVEPEKIRKRKDAT